MTGLNPHELALEATKPLAAFEGQVQARDLKSGLLGYVVRLADRRSILAGAMALGFVAAVLAVIVFLWNQLGDVQISTAGWVAMTLGALVTAALGIGLMALVFISNRRGYDEPGRVRVELPFHGEETAK